MSEVKRWYMGVYSGEAQARPTSRFEFEIIHEREGQLFVMVEDFDAQRLRADTAEAARDRLRSALSELLDCPYVLEEATIPKGGVEVAPNQVVGTVHISLGRMRKLRAALNPKPEAEASVPEKAIKP